MGALLNRTTRTISFVKNGIDLGVAFRNVEEERLYPSVGLRTPDEEVGFGPPFTAQWCFYASGFANNVFAAGHLAPAAVVPTLSLT